MSTWGNVFAFARVASSTVFGAAKAVLLGVERVAQNGKVEESSGDEPTFGPLGFYARPEPPTASASGNLSKGECECVTMRMADALRPILYRDLRIARRMNPAVGELGIAHYGGGFLTLQWDPARSGTLVTLSAPHLSSDEVDESHYLSMDPSDAGNYVALAHRSGHGLFLNKDGSAVLSSPDGKKWISVSDADGVTVASDKGMAFAGGIIAGSTTLAESVALAAAYQAALEAALPILLAAAAAANTLAPLSVTPAQIAEITARVLALSTLGKSQTLKASPT